jgi:hypothetical protein
MNFIKSPYPHILFVTFATVVLAPFSVHALLVEGTQQAIPGGYHYEFTIDNTAGPEEIAIVSLNAPLADPLIDLSLATPAGFLGSYDGGLGLVDFIGDTAFFSVGSITSGFGFDSIGTPPDFFSVFSALDVAGGQLTGTISFQSVPDAGSTLLPTCLGLCALAITQQKRSGIFPERRANNY